MLMQARATRAHRMVITLSIALALLVGVLAAPPTSADVVGPVRTAGAPSAPMGVVATIDLGIAPSNAVSPMSGPSEIGLYSLHVEWVNSVADADAPITGYTVIVARPKGSPMMQPVPMSACSAGVCSADVAAVSTGGEYTVSVYATNAYGNSSDSSVVVTVSVPEAPTDVRAELARDVQPSGIVTPMDGPNESGLYSLRVTWSPSAHPGGTPVSGYTVIVTRPLGSPMSASATPQVCGGGGCSLDVPAVNAAGEYTVSVYATNSAGHGRESSFSTTVGGPSGPEELTATLMPELAPSATVYPLAGNAEYGLRWIRAAWTAPILDGGAPVTGYTATVARPEGAPIARSVAVSSCVGGRCTVDIPAVSSAGTYVVSVYAANRAGNSPEATTTVTVAVPAPPANLTAVLVPEVPPSSYVYPMAGEREYGLYSLRAAWTPSSSADGPPVTEYRIVVDRAWLASTRSESMPSVTRGTAARQSSQ
jgi:hypothetical protein